VLLMMLIAVVVFSLPRFSAEALRATLRGDMRRDLLLMTDEIRDIDEKKMYAYGWLQCPQLMLLSGKRFQNLFDPRHAGRIKGSEAYFLTSYENKFMGEDVLDSLTKNYVLVAEHGHNRLYRLQ